MEAYEVVYDLAQVEEFARLCVPAEEQQVLALTLFARRKYAPELGAATLTLQRLFVEGGTEPASAARKILRLNCPVGSFVHGERGADGRAQAVPQQALALYASLTPKDPVRAMTATLGECVEKLTSGASAGRVLRLYHTEVERTDASSSGPALMQVDLDTKDAEQVAETKRVLREARVVPHIVVCVETRGGYHLVYRAEKDIDRKALYEFKQRTAVRATAADGKQVTDHWFSTKKDPKVVVPGTVQGGFRARLVNNFFLEA